MSGSIREQLIDFNNVMSQLELSDPSAETIRLFNKLLIFCCSTSFCSLAFERMLETDLDLKVACDSLRRLRSQYEYHHEMNWAKTYVSNGDQSLIERVFDDGDYYRLVQLEIGMLRDLGVCFSQNSTPKDQNTLLVNKVAFIGSGPIPASSMLILREYAPFVDIYNIDISHEANQLASIICKRFLPSHLFQRMHFITQDISQKLIPVDVELVLKECQLIFLAALVGDDESNKLDILQNIVRHSKNEANRKTTQHIVMRTTYGLRQVLYPRISVKSMTKNQVSSDYDAQNKKEKVLLEIQANSSPENDIVISVIIARIV